MVDQESRPAHREGLHARDLGVEYLLYDPSGNLYHLLNRTAREIFLLCDGTRSLAEIASDLFDRYQVEREVALRDAEETVSRLVDLGFLTIRS